MSEDAFTVGVKEGLHEISETVICIVCFHYLLMSTINPYQERYFHLFSHYFLILLDHLMLTSLQIFDKEIMPQNAYVKNRTELSKMIDDIL